MPVTTVPKLKPRKVREPRKKKRKHLDEPVKVPAYLTRCATMGYEVWSEKPEACPASEGGGFRNLVGWSPPMAYGTFYFRLPTVDAIAMESPLYLHKGKMRKIWLHIDITGRTEITHAEETQETEE